MSYIYTKSVAKRFWKYEVLEINWHNTKTLLSPR